MSDVIDAIGEAINNFVIAAAATIGECGSLSSISAEGATPTAPPV